MASANHPRFAGGAVKPAKRRTFSDSGKIRRREHRHMPNWKVIALVSSNIKAISGPDAQNRPGAHK
jgi:hypothetical protein